jgi:hypothetical protein
VSQVPVALHVSAVSVLPLQALVPQAEPEGKTQAPVSSQEVAAQPGSAGQLEAVQQRWPRQRLESQPLPSLQALPPAPLPVVLPPVLEAPVVVPPVVVALVPDVVPPVVAPVVVVLVVPPSPPVDEPQAAATNATKPNITK